MKTAPLHSQELLRIEALHSTGLLDTLSEDEYDSITFLASQICQTPIALISLLDSDRQWSKSKVGLSASETPRDSAFCAHAILGEELFIVEDCTKDERFFDNPLVLGYPKAIFYAGAPLIDPRSKLPLGTVCVIDHKARKLSDNQKKALLKLSRQTSILIELKQKNISLEEQRQKLARSSVAIENMQEGFVLQDQAGSIIDFNSSALEILGLTAEQMMGKTCFDPSWQAIKETGEPFPGDEHPAVVALNTGLRQSGIKMGVKSSHFKERWLNINASPIFSEQSKKPESVVVTFTDDTELMQTQVKLMDNARLISLTEMASGLSHEVNNPLAIISAACRSISKISAEPDVDRSAVAVNLDKIQDCVFRISKVVKGLQAFSRSGEKDRNSEFNLSKALNDVIFFCTEKFKRHSLTVKANIPPDIIAVGSMSRFSQVVINLLTNSFDALINQNERWIQIDLELTDQSVKIYLKDSGQGIPTEISKKMFHPFFTTKDVGKGTGLGLSVSKGFMEDMGGSLSYDFGANNTTFILEIEKNHPSKKQEVC